jgi:hypothetical protein
MKVTKMECIWSDQNDRWIYIEYDKQMKIIGLNFMQGYDYRSFLKDWCFNDPQLFEFYTEMLYTFPIEKASVSTISFINKVMWTYISLSFADQIKAKV